MAFEYRTAQLLEYQTKDIAIYQTIWNPNFKKFGIQMVGIQIPAVY